MIICIILIVVFFILLTFALAKAAGDADDMGELMWSRRESNDGSDQSSGGD